MPPALSPQSHSNNPHGGPVPLAPPAPCQLCRLQVEVHKRMGSLVWNEAGRPALAGCVWGANLTQADILPGHLLLTARVNAAKNERNTDLRAHKRGGKTNFFLDHVFIFWFPVLDDGVQGDQPASASRAAGGSPAGSVRAPRLSPRPDEARLYHDAGAPPLLTGSCSHLQQF